MTDTKSSEPFTAAEVKVQLSQNGELSLDAAGTVLHVPVMVDNQGSADLSSAVQPPVNMGVQLLDIIGAMVQTDLAMPLLAISMRVSKDL